MVGSSIGTPAFDCGGCLMSAIYNRTVFVLNPTTRTNRADENEYVYGPYQTPVVIPNCSVQMSTADEQPDDAGRVAITRWRVLTKPRSGDVPAIDERSHVMLSDGTILAVDGTPNRVGDIIRGGQTNHIEFELIVAVG